MHALSIAVFLIGASAVMAVPTHDAMPQTVADAVTDVASSPHVDAAVKGFLANPKGKEIMDEVDSWDHEIKDEINDEINEKMAEWDDENGGMDHENDDMEDEGDDMEDENDDVDNGHESDDFGNEWTEESASEVSESADVDGEEEMPSDATYEMSFDADAGEPEAEGEADHSVDVDGDGMPDNKDGDDGAMPAEAAANTTATPAEAAAAVEKEMSCTITAEGYSPKEMTVKPGATVSFKVDGEGEYSVKQTSGPTSCEPMAGGFSSKAMLKGDNWNYTVPLNATGKMYMYSGPADKCDTKMLATLNVGDNLVADTKAPSAANPSSTTSGLSSGAGSIAPALGSVAAAAVVAARTLF